MPVASFDTLPTDVIREIFLADTPARLTFIPPGKRYTIQLVVSQVCSRWRAIALDNPHLWDKIGLCIVGNDNKDETTLKLARLWFDRARNLPCSLDIGTEGQPLSQGMKDLIFTYKFKSLGSNMGTLSFLFLDRTYERALSCVEELHLGPRTSCEALQLPNVGDPSLLPSLKSLEVSWGTNSNLWQDKRMIPWYQLRRLNLHRITELSTLFEILLQCDQLEECDIYVAKIYMPEFGTTLPALPLPNLRRLTLSNTGLSSDIFEITQALVVPNLESLRLRFLDSNCFYIPGSLGSQRLEERFGSSLRNLQSFEFVTTYGFLDVGQYLVCMPYVRHFTLQGDISLDEDTAKRIATGNIGSLLETLWFGCGADPELVLDMIEERQNNARTNKLLPFTRVSFCHYSTLSDQCRERVARLEREDEVWIEMTSISTKICWAQDHRR